ncbi:GntR family transcriptional regulator [Gordonia sp. ABSL1-1]|uniref:GntR family transcriptional regulator n=1 Tax=Gordonia sp. ABSL1-1 TaxID=3053923 RepID=UPI002572308D|nr:GntR family transcriptional regulator [Gordonia sp. ABSL1-1]MDL9938637.1 GntR family transcriptional regulator [Gordonia sp. ABSL1-1]
MATRGGQEPAYRTLAEDLRRRIADGEFPEGVRLPTEAELSEAHGLSRQTVRRAFQELVADQVVYRVPGRGTFAAQGRGRYLRQLGSIEDLMNLSADTDMTVLEAPTRSVDLEAAGRLRLDTDVVYRIVFCRIHDGTPFVVTTVWWPEEIARLVVDSPDVAQGASSSYTMIGLLEPHLVSPIVECAQSITAVAADAVVAERLGCAEGRPVLRVDRMYSDRRGVAVELAVSHFLPEYYTYRVTLRREQA